MKRSYLYGVAAFALLLVGCDSKPDVHATNVVDPEAEAVGAAANALVENDLGPDSNDPTRLQTLIDQTMPTAIPDAKDAQYRNIRAGAGGAVCGEVATKPAGRGALVFRPFVINPDGLAVVASTPKLAFADPNDFAAGAWIRWCASPEELQKLAPQLRHAHITPAPGGADVQASLEPPPPDAVPSASPAKPAPKPPPASIGSFFNSVEHSSGH